jgi:hypothetical protein
MGTIAHLMPPSWVSFIGAKNTERGDVFFPKWSQSPALRMSV